MRSLRKSVIFGILFWALFAVVLAFFLLISFFQSFSLARFDSDLAAHHRRVAVAMVDTRGDPELLQAYLKFPDFQNTLSGLYWQIVPSDGELMTSPSAAFEVVALPTEVTSEPVFFEGAGPDGLVRGLHQRISLEDGSIWVVSVAKSLALLAAERDEVRSAVLKAIMITAVIGVTGVVLQMAFVLRPLTQMGREVSSRWEAGEALKVESYPTEVTPLIVDINTLLERNRGVVESARRQAADLAHALKTPTAVIRNVLERPRRGAKDIEEAKDALDRVDAQILRSLARIRAGNASAMAYKTDVRNSCNRLARLFRIPRDDRPLLIDVSVPEDLSVMMDQQDLEEVLGNLLENAVRHRNEFIRVTASREDDIVAIFVEDDGPGVPEDKRMDVLEPGRRLDTSLPGTGLGLAIAHDLVTAYDGGIELDVSKDLGGLSVVLLLPQTGHLKAHHTEDDANRQA